MTASAQDRIAILVVEDNPADVYLLREALAMRGLQFELQIATTGEEARALIWPADGTNRPAPALIVLDLNVPQFSGIEILGWIRQSPELAGVPVVVFTSSESPRDRKQTIELGADRYLRKPYSIDDIHDVGATLEQVLVEASPCSPGHRAP